MLFLLVVNIDVVVVTFTPVGVAVNVEISRTRRAPHLKFLEQMTNLESIIEVIGLASSSTDHSIFSP